MCLCFSIVQADLIAGCQRKRYESSQLKFEMMRWVMSMGDVREEYMHVALPIASVLGVWILFWIIFSF